MKSTIGTINLSTYNPSCWTLANAIAGAVRKAIFWGPPATGKTFAGQNLGKKEGQETVSVTLTDETTAADLIGYYIQTDKGFRWNDGPITHAWRVGARLVLNELNHMSSDAEACLFNVLDDMESASMRLMNGEVVIPHENFSCVASCNVNPADFLREGMLSRFEVIIHIDQPTKEAVAQLSSEPLQRAAIASDAKWTLRHYRAFDQLSKKVPLDLAAEAVFGKSGQAILDSLTIANTNNET